MSPGFHLALLACTASQQPTVTDSIVTTDVELFVRTVSLPSADGGLIVLHGGPGVSHDHLRVLDRLVDDTRFDVVYFDQRGVGRSSAPVLPEAYELADYDADLDAVRTSVGWDRVHLLGHSWGGLAALSYAIHHPEHVASLAIIDSAPPAKALTRDIPDERVASLQLAGVIPFPIPRVVDGDCTAWLRARIPALNARPETMIGDQLGASTCRTEPRERTWAALGDYDLVGELGSIRAPVLVLYGTEDPFGVDMVGAVARHADLLGDTLEEVAIAGCGHRPMHECPEPFFTALDAFYDSLPRRREATHP
jgi:proline iminopeptidase